MPKMELLRFSPRGGLIVILDTFGELAEWRQREVAEYLTEELGATKTTDRWFTVWRVSVEELSSALIELMGPDDIVLIVSENDKDSGVFTLSRSSQ